MATSDERREVAKALRGSFLDPTDELEAALLHAFDYTRDDAEYFDLDYGAMLADLIDQTTTVDETGVETVVDAVHLCECNECGHSFEWVYGEYEYCPRCGSRIVGGNEYEKASNPVPLEGGGAE